MASAANESHATSSGSIDNENWKYVECAKCREGAVLQDQQDPNGLVIRDDFQLTACGHVTCMKCLEVSTGEDGSYFCPKCQHQQPDTIPILDAQNNPVLAPYFRSVETMLAELSQSIRFQTSNLRDQAAFYKNIANKQSAALKVTKKELAELRAMKKNYEALQRENAALKHQLANGHQVQTSPLLQHASQTYERAPLSVEQYRSHDGPVAGTSSNIQSNHRNESRQLHHADPALYHNTHLPEQYQARQPLQTQPEALARVYSPAVHPSLKRSAQEAGLSVQPHNLPPRLRESELPAHAMSSAHRNDEHEERENDKLGTETQGDASDFLKRFRFQAGQSAGSPARSASRQCISRNSHEQAYATRRSSSRSSRAELPAIEEAPFQQNSMRGDTAHPSDTAYNRNKPGYERHDEQYQLNYQQRELFQSGSTETGNQQGFVQASVLHQPQASNNVPDYNNARPGTFRPLMARQSNNSTLSSTEIRQSHAHAQHQHSSPQTMTTQRPFQPGTARPATAQAGSTSNQQYGRSQHQMARPATAQASRLSAPSASRVIRPMAITPAASRPSQSSTNRGGNAFKYQPERR